MFGRIRMKYNGEKVDVLPYAKMAVALLEPDEKMDAKALAKFFVKQGGEKVLKRDNPFELNFHRVNDLISRIVGWLNSAHRIKQLKHPDLVEMRPLVEIIVERAPCEHTLALNGQIMPASELPLLPPPDCPLGTVFCNYRSIDLKEAKKRGLI